VNSKHILFQVLYLELQYTCILIFSYHLACDDGYFGMNCTHQCYCRYGACIKSRGECLPEGCQRGWKGDTCSEGKLQISILFNIISSV